MQAHINKTLKISKKYKCKDDRKSKEELEYSEHECVEERGVCSVERNKEGGMGGGIV